MKNVYTFVVALLFAGKITQAQVPKKILVEHFTNSVCSVCAGLNPGFYSNLNKQSGVIHIAIHPSSPYSSCILNKQNVAENDARTNYYGVYGSTPRLAIQGVVIPSNANYSSSSLFTPYLGQSSPASIKIYQYKFGKDSIRSKIVIKTAALHSLSNLKLIVFLAEDTVFYSSPNGETKHFDVFRKTLTGTSGISISLPEKVGDSIVYIQSSPSNAAWNFSRIYTLAVLQDGSSKAIIQSEAVPANTNDAVTSIEKDLSGEGTVNVFIEKGMIVIQQHSTMKNLNFSLYDLSGKKIIDDVIQLEQSHVAVGHVHTGIYLFAVKSNGMLLKTGKLFLKNSH